MHSSVAEQPEPLIETVPPGVPPALGANLAVEDLRDLMQSVMETSHQLQSTHVVLQREVARLKAELAQANAQLKRSQALAELGGMAAGIAHEIRNPLGSIQLYVQMLAEDLVDQPELASMCGKIDRAVGGLDGIVRDVLLFARDVRMNVSPATTRQLLDLALERCASLLQDSPIEIVRDEADDFELRADSCLLAQALANIVRNAIDAMRDHVEPAVLTLGMQRRMVRCPDRSRAERLVLSVQDTGPGIADEDIERIFNPFFTTRATGTGLGLAIVHRIIDAHDGHVQVRRLEPRGTCFELCLKADGPADDACVLDVMTGASHLEPHTLEQGP